MSEIPDIEKIIELAAKELGVNPDDIDIDIPSEFKSLEEAVSMVKEIYFKEVSAEINNKLTSAYTAPINYPALKIFPKNLLTRRLWICRKSLSC